MGEGPSASTLLEMLAQLPGNGHENDQTDDIERHLSGVGKNSTSSIHAKTTLKSSFMLITVQLLVRAALMAFSAPAT